MTQRVSAYAGETSQLPRTHGVFLREKSLNVGTDSKVNPKLIVIWTLRLPERTAYRSSEFPWPMLFRRRASGIEPLILCHRVVLSAKVNDGVRRARRRVGRIPSVRRGRRALDQGRDAPFIGTASELLRIRIESRHA
jgi:hypothetical protein